MIGTRLSHYEIIGLLGKGGMGEVYRARDLKLEREVAIKILPPEMALDPERLARFKREAKTVAGLNHPSIVTLYSVEEADGVHFLTMELVEGESLDTGLDPEGLPLSRVLEVGIALADALAVAHAKGVVHRDLKPANVMLTVEGRVKVLDFGLAKLVDEASPAADGDAVATRVVELTQQGSVMGTRPYMSPEQLRGGTTDHRSDIFALGILLYELVTGRRPFQGPTSVDVTSAILRDSPPPLMQVRPNLPRHLGRIVTRCLEKEPQRRYQSAIEVRNELDLLRREVESGIHQPASAAEPVSSPQAAAPAPTGRRRSRTIFAMAGLVVAVGAVLLLGKERWTGDARPADGSSSPTSATASTAPRHSIAVLPFVNMTNDPDQEYFADGIAEELLNLLAQVPQLQVAARTSSFSFKGKDVAVPEIARRLAVAHVLEGSVRMSGQRVRITAQLIRAEDGFHLWSGSYDRTLDDVFAIQDEIAADVVRQLKVEILGETPSVPATDPAAYALFLQSRHLARLGTADGFARAGDLLQQVLAADPRYARAWSDLARIYANQAGVGLIPSGEGYALSRAAAEEALAIDPRLAAAHARLAWIAMFHDGDLAAAAGHLRRGLDLEPYNDDVLRNAAILLKNLGRLDEAIALGESAVDRDPLNPTGHSNLGFAYFYAERWDAAVAAFRTALTLSPGRIAVRYSLGSTLLMEGDAQAALELTEQEPFELFRLTGLVMVHHALGNAESSNSFLAELMAKHEQDAAYNIAYALAYRGEVDRAFAWLERAIAYEDAGLGDIMVEPRFRALHDDPRWPALLRRLGKSPEQLAGIEFRVAGSG